jgi:hypothetical protein
VCIGVINSGHFVYFSGKKILPGTHKTWVQTTEKFFFVLQSGAVI